jgi:hypothetical protein
LSRRWQRSSNRLLLVDVGDSEEPPTPNKSPTGSLPATPSRCRVRTRTQGECPSRELRSRAFRERTRGSVTSCRAPRRRLAPDAQSRNGSNHTSGSNLQFGPGIIFLIFSSIRSLFKAFGCWGSGDGEFKGLEGVAVMANGNILVCDRENHLNT